MKAELKLIRQALEAVEWAGDTSIWSPTCYWCNGYQRHPAMDQDYYGKSGHKPDCLRQRALAALAKVEAKCSLIP